MISEREPAPSGSAPKAPDQPLENTSQAEAQFPQATLVCKECGKQILCLAIKFSPWLHWEVALLPEPPASLTDDRLETA